MPGLTPGGSPGWYAALADVVPGMSSEAAARLAMAIRAGSLRQAPLIVGLAVPRLRATRSRDALNTLSP
jgi:hypothetical protein